MQVVASHGVWVESARGAGWIVALDHLRAAARAARASGGRPQARSPRWLQSPQQFLQPSVCNARPQCDGPAGPPPPRAATAACVVSAHLHVLQVLRAWLRGDAAKSTKYCYQRLPQSLCSPHSHATVTHLIAQPPAHRRAAAMWLLVFLLIPERVFAIRFYARPSTFLRAVTTCVATSALWKKSPSHSTVTARSSCLARSDSAPKKRSAWLTTALRSATS